jgi:hypothetical protein
MTGLESLISLLDDLVAALSSQLPLQIGAWLLVWVFAWSGTSKLLHPATAAQALVDFRVTRFQVPGFGVALGAVELGLAAAIASPLARRPSLAVATGLLCAFSVLITVSLLRGERFPCRCFGNSDAPLSRWTVGRTAVLAAVALVLAVENSAAVNPAVSETVLQAVAALALLGTIVVAGSFPSLLSWNREPLPIWPGSNEE